MTQIILLWVPGGKDDEVWREAWGSALAQVAVPRKPAAEQWWGLMRGERWQMPKNLSNAEALLSWIGTHELFPWTPHYTWGRGMLQVAQLYVRRWWGEQILCCYYYSDPTYTQGSIRKIGSNYTVYFKRRWFNKGCLSQTCLKSWERKQEGR